MSAAPPRLPPRPPTRDDATACLWSNLAVPGLGSWRAGWRVSGALQLTLAVGALGLGLVWFGWFLTEWLRAGKLPMLVIWDNDGRLPAGWFNYLLLGLGSLVLFGLAIAWAFITSMCIRAEAQRHESR